MSRQEEQAGLEVINYPTHSSPGNASFSTHSPSPGYLHPPQEYGEKIPVHEDQQLGSSATHKSTDPRANRKRRPLWMVIAVIGVVLVVVAAVVGGVVGSKSKKHHESTEGHGTEQSTLIRNKSSLAVTGWRSEGNSNIQLFWQGKDDFVYYSAWHSEQQSWNKPTKLSIGASPGTPMAASIIFLNPLESGGARVPQVQFYYMNSSDFVNGENFGSTFANGHPDSINEAEFVFKMDKDSALAAYWPAIIYESSGIQGIWYSQGYANTSQALADDSVVGGAPFGVLPLESSIASTSHTDPQPNLKLIYRRDDGFLYEFNKWVNGTVTKNDKIDGFEVDPKSSLAVFATARKKSNQGLDSYLIYQAKDGKIMYGTNTNSSGWVGPSSDGVFDGADHPTSLACVTAGTDDDGIPLTSETDLNRCYFQRNGELAEVTFDGSKWAASGAIPLA